MTKTAFSRRAPWLAALAFMTLGAPTQAAVFCVNSAGTLQTALTTAASNGADDEIRIVQGNYVGNFVYASTQANKLSVLGGYAAGCASRTLNPANTVLDGNQVNTVLALSAPDQAAEFLVEGLTLRNGKRTSGTGQGGGLYALTGDTGAVTVRRNQIEKNTRSGHGGGAYVSASTITLTNNNFSGNSSEYGNGGGAYVASTSTSTITLTNNNFSGNSSENWNGNGGGAYVASTSTSTTSTSSSTSTITLTNNSFSGNSCGSYSGSYSSSDGGGAYIYVGYYGTSTVTLNNNSFSGNSSQYGYGGGAYVANYYSTSTIALTNNSFSGNSSQYAPGGAYVASTSISTSTSTLTNNNFAGNSSQYGYSGAYVASRTITLTNNSFVGNGLSLRLGNTETTDSATLYNNLFWNNVATDNQGADLNIYNDSDGDYLPTPVTLFGNNFNQSAAGFQITIPIAIHSSNLNGLDPLFVDAANNDLRLLPGSPMINAGDPNTPDLPETDLDGNPRIVGGIVDIGAYEYQDVLVWQIAEIYLASMGYAPDSEGLDYWIDEMTRNSAWIPATVAQSFFDQPLVKAAYPDSLGYGGLIEALYRNLFDREADAEGYAYWLTELESGRVLRNQMIIALINGGRDNPDAATDMARFDNRIRVSLAFVAAQRSRGIVYSALDAADQSRLRQAGVEVISTVTADPATTQPAIDRIGQLLDNITP